MKVTFMFKNLLLFKYLFWTLTQCMQWQIFHLFMYDLKGHWRSHRVICMFKIPHFISFCLAILILEKWILNSTITFSADYRYSKVHIHIIRLNDIWFKYKANFLYKTFTLFLQKKEKYCIKSYIYDFINICEYG